MPFMMNGIGTWYYGQRNIHRLQGVCSQCGAANTLESYDTTLYFVVFLIPVLPLARKRILEKCSSCSRHQVLPLKEWERIKSEAVHEALEKLRQDPHNRETILQGIGVAASFQDEELFEKLSGVTATDRTDDAAIQAALGGAYGYFARHQEAAAAYVLSLKVDDNPQVREQLGLTFLRLGDPERAAGCFQHILDEADPEKAWMPYQLVVAYQSKGMHTEALELLDRMLEKFPQLASDKAIQKLRKISVRDAGRNRPVGQSILQEGRKSGTHTGSALGGWIPKLVLPLLILSFLGWHTWQSLTLANARPMYIINGSSVAYDVKLNDTAYHLPAGSTQSITLPEGVITIAPANGTAIEPAEVRYESTFFARPYDSTQIIINPDRLAILVQETTTYSEIHLTDDPPGTYFVGLPLYEFRHIDYVFLDFPAKMKVKKGQTLTRNRLGIVPQTTDQSRVEAIAGANLGLPKEIEYARRWLLLAPENAMALAFFNGVTPITDALPFLKSRLADRPLNVEWHRLTQTLRQRSGEPEAALRPEYTRLVDELRRDPDALYLLARVSEPDVAKRLLQEAIDSGKPAERAHYALGYRHFTNAEYTAAVAEMEKAPGLITQVAYRHVYWDALFATKRYAELRAKLADAGDRLDPLLYKFRVCEVMGDATGSAQVRDAILQHFPESKPPLGALAILQSMRQPNDDRARITQILKSISAMVRGNIPAYLDAVKAEKPTVVSLLLHGDRLSAEAQKTNDVSSRGLILLATPRQIDPALQAAKTAFLTALETAGDPELKRLKMLLETGDPASVKRLKELTILPETKRVCMAAAALWFPDQRNELLAFARKLDFHKDAVSLVLQRYLPRPGAK